MGGRCGEAAQGREPLLARQHGLGHVQGQLHTRRLARRQPGVAGREGDPGDDRGRRPQPVDQRQDQVGPPGPGQGHGPDSQDRGRDYGEGGQHQRVPPRQGRSGQGHRRDQQHDERIGRSAGEEQERRQLDDVERQLQRRLCVGSQPPPQADEAGGKVDRGAERNEQGAQQIGRAIAQRGHGHSDDDRLSRHGDPAQGRDGVQAEAAADQTPLARAIALQAGFRGVTHDQRRRHRGGGHGL